MGIITNMVRIKKNIALVWITILLLVINSNMLIAQDVQFSQLFSDRLYLNPAYAGTDYCPRIMVSYRNQWPGVQFPYVTYSVSYDQYSEIVHGGLGIRMMKDDQGGGVFSMLNADFIYAYKVKINSNISLKLALEASIYQRSVNANDLVFADMIDSRFGVVFPNSESINIQAIFTPDFSASMLFNYKKYFFGVNVSHIPQSIVAEHNLILPMKITAHIGAAFPIIKNDSKSSSYILEPNVVYIQQQNFNMLYYGMYFDISSIALGVFFRQDLKLHYDALVLSFHMDAKQFKIGYSYDATLSSFFGHSLGTHEISLSYLFNCRKKIKDYSTISCPVF